MTRLERVLRIQSDERPLVAWMVGFFAVVQSSHGLGANAADALFFQRFGVSQLPLMILISGPAVMIFVLGHSAGLASRDNARWLRLLMLVCASWAAVESMTARQEWPAAYPVIWVSTQVVIMLTFTAMWNAAGAACTTRQAKRLFPIFATAGIAGGVVGNLATGPLAALIGTPNLLVVQSTLLVVGFLVLFPLARFFPAEEAVASAGSLLGSPSSILVTVRSNRLLRLGAMVAAAMSCLFYLVYFPFSQQVAGSFDTETEIAAFLGVFASIATTATFLVSLLLTNRLFARFGIVVSLLLVPLVYAGGFGTWLVVFTLSSAALVRGLQWVTTNAIGGTAFTALFNVASGRRRAQIVSFMTAVPAQIGTMLGGGLLLLTTSAPQSTVFVVGLLVATLAVIAVFAVRSAYVDALVATVRAGMPHVFEVPQEGLFTPTDADAVRVLEAHLDDPRPEARALAVAWLSHLRGRSGASEIAQLLGDDSPQVRVAAFDSMCAIDPARISSHAATAIRDEMPEIRLHALGYLQQNPDAGDRSVGRLALTDTDPRVRAAAAILIGGEEGQGIIDDLLGDIDPRSVAAALNEIARPGVDLTVESTRFLDHDSPAVREAAVAAVAAHGGDIQLLSPRLDDRSPRVRSAAGSALLTTDAGRAALLEVLESGSVVASEAALRAMTPLEGSSEQFIAWAGTEAKRASWLAAQALALDVAPISDAQGYLIRVLRMRRTRLVEWVLRAMTTRATEAVMRVVARGVRSGDTEIRAQAIEALETLGVRSVTTVLLPLLEGETDLGGDVHAALEELANDFDPWLQALARQVMAERSGSTVASWSGMEPYDLTASLDPMDRIMMLQRTRMFSELDPEDLDLVARASTIRIFDPGETIFTAGDEGDGMLLIVRGEAVVTVGSESKRRVVQTYGAGEPVGELALLLGQPRSANVHAGSRGVMGLVLSSADLLSVLEERPVVALGMLRTLARRLIDQTQ